MALKLMYITNRPEVALIAENAGVDRIFVDMEYIGKGLRQGGMDSVQNHHTVGDVCKIRKVLTKSDLLVRVNPIHEETRDYCSSEDEINQVIAAGADIIMLPFFKTADEVQRFISYVKGRAKTLLLLETPEAVGHLDEILGIPGIDEIHIGINDLSLGYGKTFMFELLVDGTVENLCSKINKVGIPYGFGGVAAIGSGTLPAEAIIKEHYRLGSSMVILSRSFCRIDNETDIHSIRDTFESGVHAMREFENEIAGKRDYYDTNKKMVADCVSEIVQQINKNRSIT